MNNKIRINNNSILNLNQNKFYRNIKINHKKNNINLLNQVINKLILKILQIKEIL